MLERLLAAAPEPRRPPIEQRLATLAEPIDPYLATPTTTSPDSSASRAQ